MSMSVMKRAPASVLGLFCPNVYNGAPVDGIFAGGEASKQPMEDELDNVCEDAEARRGAHRAAVKPLRFPPSTNADGSVPPSPGSPALEKGQAGYLEMETRQLVSCCLREHAGLPTTQRGGSRAQRTLRRVVEDVINKHQIAYNGMIQKLYLDQRGDDMSFVSTVANNLFNDGTTNWGRIASLVAFSAVLSKHLKQCGRSHCVDEVSERISSYLMTHQQEWICANKGWDGFAEFFHTTDPESIVRSTLVALAGVASLGAGLAYLIR